MDYFTEKEETVIQHTINWIKNVVIDLNFCPFASKVFLNKSIRYTVLTYSDINLVLEKLDTELRHLDENADTETTFIILPHTFHNFNLYLDLVDAAEQLISDNGYEGVYQVASFHPLYLFANSDESDPANYTNRSIYPMLHLLREESIDKALENYKSPDSIPARNINFAREKGLAYMKMLRDVL